MIPVVLKCGGSLTRSHGLKALCQRLAVLGRRYPFLVVPGGGPFADTVRSADRRYGLADTTAHWMAVLAMDQFGYLLGDLIPEGRTVRDLESAQCVALAGKVPVLLPADLLRRADPLPHSWDVTSDSISAWIARMAGASRLVLLKDVDGLYAPSSTSPDAILLETLNLEQLAECDGVDARLTAIIADTSLDLWIINGNQPDRLERLLAGARVHGTHLQR